MGVGAREPRRLRNVGFPEPIQERLESIDDVGVVGSGVDVAHECAADPGGYC